MSRRWRIPLIVRRRRVEVVPVPAVVAPTAIAPPVLSTRRRFGTLRRGKVYSGFPLQSNPISFQAQQQQHPRVTRTRRGRVISPPWTATVTTAPPYVPQQPRRSLRTPYTRRSKFTDAGTLPVQAAVPWVAGRRTRSVPTRRSHITTPVPAPVVALPPNFVSDEVQRTPRVLFLRHSRLISPPLAAQVAPPPPANPPQFLHTYRVRPLRRVGRFQGPTPPQPQQVVQRIASRPSRAVGVRRGSFKYVPSPTVTPVVPTYVRHTQLRVTSRHSHIINVLTQPATVAPAVVPKVLHTSVRTYSRTASRRTRFAQVWHGVIPTGPNIDLTTGPIQTQWSTGRVRSHWDVGPSVTVSTWQSGEVRL
jgi:hypothetical protein